MTAGLPRSRSKRERSHSLPSRGSAQSLRPCPLRFRFRGSYDSNIQLCFGEHQRRRRGYGGSGNQRRAVRSQPVLIDDADGAGPDGSSRAQALHVLRQPALRGRPRALSSAHGLLRHAGRGRGMAGRRARDLPGCLGRRSPGPEAPRASLSGGRRSGPACRRTSATGRTGACARPRSRTCCGSARGTRRAARCAAHRPSAARGSAGCQARRAAHHPATDHRADARA